MELLDAEVACCEDFGVVIRDGGRDDDGVSAAHVLGFLAAERNFCAELFECLDDARAAAVGARDVVAELAEDFGERAHAGAADADEMDMLDALEFFQISFQDCFLISCQATASYYSHHRFAVPLPLEGG